MADEDATQAIDRAARILVGLIESDELVSLASIIERTGLSESTAARLLPSLERNGFAQRGPSGTFRPGRVLVEYSRRETSIGDLAARPDAGHGKDFKEVAVARGLQGKMTMTTNGPVAVARLKEIIAKIGPYPHATLTGAGRKPQTTRMLKLVCPACGCTVRMTQTWLDYPGPPTCACQVGAPFGEPMQESV